MVLGFELDQFLQSWLKSQNLFLAVKHIFLILSFNSSHVPSCLYSCVLICIKFTTFLLAVICIDYYSHSTLIHDYFMPS